MLNLRLVKDDTNINFMGVRWAALGLTLFIIIGSFVLLMTRGLNYGIDFAGGTLIEIKTPAPADIGQMRVKLDALNLGHIMIQEFGAPDDVLIRLQQQEGGEAAQKAAQDKVKASLDAGVQIRRVEFVGPQVGGELVKAGVKAAVFALLGIFAYIWFRFEWQFGVAAILALLHDMIATLGFFALTQIEFDLSTVAAVLMIAGYSNNDTVVVFDRIRENLRRFRKMPVMELSNLTINQTLSRTLMTSLTTLLSLAALWLFGGEVIRSFTDALIVGIAVGTYSSIYIATPLWMMMLPAKALAGRGESDLAVAAG